MGKHPRGKLPAWSTKPQERPGARPRGQSNDPHVITLAGRYGGPIELEAVLDGVWRVDADVSQNEGRLVITDLRIRPAPGATLPWFGITSTVLRQLRLDDFRGKAVRLENAAQQRRGTLLTTEEARRLMKGPTDPRRLTDDDLARLALAYIDAYATDPQRPVKELAKRFGAHRDTLAGRIKLARQRDWLPKAPRGVPTAGLTPRLRTWRDAHTDTEKPSKRSRRKK
jgi:hypothetical protein